MKKSLLMMISSNQYGKEVKSMKRTFLVIAIVFAGVLALHVQAVQAIPVLYLSDGSHSIKIQDNGSGDINPLDGVVTFSGGLGSWIVNVSTGITKPVLGSAASPLLDLNSVNVTSKAGGHLEIWFMESGFGPFSGTLTSSVGGSTSGTVSFETWIGNTTVSSLGPYAFSPFSATTSVGASLTPFDQLFAYATIDHKVAGASSFDYEVKGVPEPGTLLLLGSGLAGLSIFARRMKR